MNLFANVQFAPNVEQVIRVDGRWVRLAPGNMFPVLIAQAMPRLTLESDGSGFYRTTTKGGFTAHDVTCLWNE